MSGRVSSMIRFDFAWCKEGNTYVINHLARSLGNKNMIFEYSGSSCPLSWSIRFDVACMIRIRHCASAYLKKILELSSEWACELYNLYIIYDVVKIATGSTMEHM